ncbi:hypothetical protein [Bacillus sp. FJAT-22090]|uniref:hypothetical protein n=1 Tax=Bacillus sp. FJAT-22090 TaxID=1581038 RepID=UPI0011A91ABE|nr:hypothetical protein [Bacillus sp. FJAT-22090]
MRNSDGFSWPETILALSITFIIASTLLPLLNNMNVKLEEKKRKYYSSLVMHEAAKMYISENTQSGSRQIEMITYTFQVDNEKICVHYEGMREERENCVTISYEELLMRKDIP